MKKPKLILILLLAGSTLTVFGQEIPEKNERSHSPWSIVLVAYSPHYAFSFNPTYISRPYRKYPMGFSGRIEFRQDSERVSVSLGVNFRKKSIRHLNPDFTENVNLIELPIQVNYHLRKSTGRFDPYLLASFRLCHFKSDNYSTSEPGFITRGMYDDYLPAIGVGFGTMIRFNEGLRMVMESNIGYGLSDAFPNRGYIDILIGINLKI